MSWQIIVQDIPLIATNVTEIPNDFKPSTLGYKTDIIELTKRNYSNLKTIDINTYEMLFSDCSVLISFPDTEEIDYFTLDLNGNCSDSIVFIHNLLKKLLLRGFDTNTGGIFSINNYLAGYEEEVSELVSQDEYYILDDAADIEQPFYQLLYDFKYIYTQKSLSELFPLVINLLKTLIKAGYIKIIHIEDRTEISTGIDLPIEKAVELIEQPILWDTKAQSMPEYYAYYTSALGKRILDYCDYVRGDIN